MARASVEPAACPVTDCSFGEESGANYGELTEHVCQADDPAHERLRRERDWYCYD